MEPLPPTSFNRLAGFSVGFVVGIGAQMLFRTLADALIGPVSVFFSSRTLALIAMLLVPPVVSLIFVRITPGSVSEELLRGFRVGSFLWLALVLASISA